MFNLGAQELVVLLLLMFGDGVGVALGGPPLPEDPVPANIAPEECLAYIASFGAAKPDPRSPNQTEKLFAEPEVQKLASKLESLFLAQLASSKDLDARGKVLAKEGPTLLKTLMTRPMAVYASRFKLGEDGPPDVRAGAVLNLGDRPEEVAGALKRCLATLPEGVVKDAGLQAGAFQQIALGPKGPSVLFGVKGKYLYVSIGKGEMEALLKRTDGAAPKWLTALRKRLDVPRVASVSMVNVEALARQFGPMAGPEFARVMKATGLDGVQRLEGVSGLDKEGYVSRSLIATRGEPKGLLRVGKGLRPADLAVLPLDATFAVAGGLDPEKTLETVLEIVEKIDEGAARSFRSGLDHFQKETGLSPVKDLVKPLGNAFCVFDSLNSGLFTGVTAVLSVKDAKAARATQEKVLRLLEKVNARGDPRHRTKVEKLTVAGQTVYALAFSNKEAIVAPAWCLTDKHLVVALYPEAIKEFLSRDDSFRSLDAFPGVRSALAEKGETIGLLYVNTPRLFDLAYPAVTVFANTLSAQLRREGIDVPVGLLPHAGAIRRHLRPSLTTKRRTADGIELVARQTLPSSFSLSTAPVAVGLLLPAVQKVREAAARAQTQNNLKQIGIAFHNYASAYNGKFPAQAIYSKQGKPLLSWRVTILPYIEQQNLYNEFKLDEPWDSEHNKKLLEKMPKTYDMPGNKAPKGYTYFQGFAGKDAFFDGKRTADLNNDFSFKGTSNTLMVVEAGKAVPWTKPEDIPFDAAKKLPKMGAFYQGNTQALLCDGTVKVLPADLREKTLKWAIQLSNKEPPPADW